MLEQFGREFQQLYPNARLLIATKDDLARDRRKLLDRQGRKRRVGRHHRDPQLVRANRDVPRLPGAVSCVSRLPSTKSSFVTTPEAADTIACSPKHHQDNREAKGKPRGAAQRPPGRGQERRWACLRRAWRRPPLHRRSPLFQEPRDPDQDGSGRRHSDRRQRAGLRPLHEGPIPRRETRRPRGDVRHGHADLQHDGRDVHDAAVPRPRGLTEPRHRALRRLGGYLRRGDRHDGNLPDGATLQAPQPLCSVREPA